MVAGVGVSARAEGATVPARVEGDDRARLAAIARMYYLDDLGQTEIASIVGISRSQVSRLLTRARETGVVRIAVDEYDPRDRALEGQLIDRFRLRHAVVVRTHERGTEHVRRSTGYFGAPAVASLIRSGTVIGLAGGRTLAELVTYLTPLPDVRGATTVQLMGNIGPMVSEIDAVELCRTLAQRLAGTFYTINAPAIAQDREARDHFLAHEHIQSIWNLFRSLQLALVGVGSLDESAFIDRGAIPPAERARLRQLGAVGEVCGRFFDAAGRECQSDYVDRVISIDLETLRHCPEVVAVTNGARRAAAVRAALDGRLVTSLVIDEEGARGLLALDETSAK